MVLDGFMTLDVIKSSLIIILVILFAILHLLAMLILLNDILDKVT